MTTEYMLAPPIELNRIGIGGFLEATDEALELMTFEEASAWRILPLRSTEDFVEVALADNKIPVDQLDLLAHRWGRVVVPHYTDKDVLERSIAYAYSMGSAAGSIAKGQEVDTPIVRYVSWVIEQGIRTRASDIHFEPMKDRLRVRFRIDGQLEAFPSPEFQIWPSVLGRIKLLAGLLMDEHRYPQEGGIRFVAGGADWDVRVSTLPGLFGEGVVLRLLARSALPESLQALGMEDDHAALASAMITSRDGLVLAVGPTGSGKSTTIYTLLQQLDPLQQKIITVEDPVEYRIEHVSQVAVQRSFGLTFAKNLRAILRQAPDVILVGEIRDAETANMALSASMTGHLVLSTLHALDAPSSITRLQDLGIEPFLLSSALRGVIAQRLVRKLCSHCSVPSDATPYERQQMQLLGRALGTLYREDGCSRCAQQGYQGRVGIFECLTLSEALAAYIDSRAPLHVLRNETRKGGVRSLLMDGLNKVEHGLTTLDALIGVSV